MRAAADVMVAWATSIRLSTSRASMRAVFQTMDLSLRVTAATVSRMALIFTTPSSMLFCVRNTPACCCMVERMLPATSWA
ncbi:hypothetical protein D3C78_1431930 [compost metagenome]